MSAAAFSASARPFAINGIALVIPPVPVLVADPRTRPLEPQLNRKRRAAQISRTAERRVLTRTVQLQGSPADGGVAERQAQEKCDTYNCRDDVGNPSAPGRPGEAAVAVVCFPHSLNVLPIGEQPARDLIPCPQ